MALDDQQLTHLASNALRLFDDARFLNEAARHASAFALAVLSLKELVRRGQAAIKNDIAAHESERGLEPTDLFLDRVRTFLHKLAMGDSSTS